MKTESQTLIGQGRLCLPLLVLDDDLRITDVNAPCCEWLGRDAEDLVNTSLAEILASDFKPKPVSPKSLRLCHSLRFQAASDEVPTEEAVPCMIHTLQNPRRTLVLLSPVASEDTLANLKVNVEQERLARIEAEQIAGIRLDQLREANRDLDDLVMERTEALQHQLYLGQITLQAAFELMRAEPEELAATLHRNLERIAHGAELDRITIYAINPDRATIGIPHEWCGEGIPSARIMMPGEIALKDFDSLGRHLMAHNILVVNDAGQLDDSVPGFRTVNNFIRLCGGKSLVKVPIMVDRNLQGLINFVRMHRQEAFDPVVIQFLQAICVVISNVITREELWRRKSDSEQRMAQAMRLESLGVMAGGIAHDFNNILTAIMGTSQLALELMPEDGVLEDPEDFRGLISETLVAARRARDLVKQILVFSRKHEVEAKPVVFQDIVEEVLVLIRASIPKTIKIVERFDAADCHVLADPTQVHQVLMNLCTNAYQAMARKGELTLTIDCFSNSPDLPLQAVTRMTPPPELPEGEYLHFACQDTGPGIAPEVLPRLFEPFFTTKELGKGTGMGLAVVHGIITAHGGAIEVETTVGEGSTFHIWFPIHGPAEGGEDGPESIAGPAARSVRIYVVDDEPSVAMVTSALLQNRGHSVETFPSAIDCLDRLGEAAPDVVLTDLSMPVMTGRELAEAVRESHPDLPVILCTGLNELEDARWLENTGVVLLKKPFMRAELYQAVEKTGAGE